MVKRIVSIGAVIIVLALLVLGGFAVIGDQVNDNKREAQLRHVMSESSKRELERQSSKRNSSSEMTRTSTSSSSTDSSSVSSSSSSESSNVTADKMTNAQADAALMDLSAEERGALILREWQERTAATNNWLAEVLKSDIHVFLQQQGNSEGFGIPVMVDGGVMGVKIDGDNRIVSSRKLVFTGPVSDLGTVLEQDPSLADKIDRLVVMAGTFGAGNIAEPEQDGTAEWNVFWDPQAFKVVFDSNIKIQMVGLESTHEVPLTPADRLRWAKLRSHPVMDFIGQAYATVPVLTHFETNSTYFLWDVLTTAFAQNPTLVETKQMTVDVVPTGQSRGRTFETPAGRDIEFVYHVDHDAFFKFFEETILAIENY